VFFAIGAVSCYVGGVLTIHYVVIVGVTVDVYVGVADGVVAGCGVGDVVAGVAVGGVVSDVGVVVVYVVAGVVVIGVDMCYGVVGDTIDVNVVANQV